MNENVPETAACGPEEPEKSGKRNKTIDTVLKVLLVIACTGILVVLLLFFAGYMIVHGPYENVRTVFVGILDDTMTLRMIPRLYLSEEEIDKTLYSDNTDNADDGAESVPADAPLESYELTSDVIKDSVANTDSEDMIELIDVSGPNWKGKMLIVHDPSLVTLAAPDSYDTYAFKEIPEFVEEYGAVAGITAAGYTKDRTPYGYVIKDGKIISGADSSALPFVGFDEHHILHVGRMTPGEALKQGVVNGVAWKPILVQDGVKCTDFGRGVSARTAIGQRADGTVLLVVIEGRSLKSIGATYGDLADLMEEYGAVNAMNLEGGGSAVMVYEGEMITRLAVSSDFSSARELPNAFVVLPAVDDD